MEEHTLFAEEEEEAVSLNNLPVQLHLPMKDSHGSITKSQTPEKDFDFIISSLSQNPEMCSADELFFQGQILPLQQPCITRSTSLPKSENVEHRRNGITESLSSSSTSRSSSSSSDNNKKVFRPRNPFYSHPSPSPRIFVKRAQNNSNGVTSFRKSSAWNIFRQGLVTTPPQITTFSGLRQNIYRGKYYNSTTMTGACKRNKLRGKYYSSTTMTGACKRNKLRGKGGGVDNLLLSGCNCSLDAVLDPVSSATPRVVAIKRSEISDGDRDVHTRLTVRFQQDQMLLEKKRKSHDRTFEWLKQLQIATDFENIAGNG